MESPKAEALQLIQKLPDSASLEDIMYELYVLEKLRAGQRALADGDSMTQAELEQAMQSW